jgi:hypothetical protein
VSSQHRKGNAGEAFVKDLLEREGYLVIDLAPWFPCDHLAIKIAAYSGTSRMWYHLWAESKVCRRQKGALTPDERRFLRDRLKAGDLVRVYHLVPEKGSFRIRYLLAGKKALARRRR